MPEENGSKKGKIEWDGMVIGGKYVVKDVIGEGGMGVVLEAENTVIQLPVAIKLLHKVLTKSDKATERFHREARTAAATGHAHIVEIYDMGETDDGSPFIVMELLKGNNLQQVLRKEKILDPQRAAGICIQLLSALSAVHAKGILHRDLKPANVILVPKKRKADFVKLVDFGISKIHEHRMEQKDLTDTGVVMGTPHYMSPEQARGEKDVDHRADLYAIGAMLYRCVSGKVPYPGKNYNQILARILAQPPPPVKEIRPQVPSKLVEIINRAMARDREQRYETAAVFAADLAEFCHVNISVSSSDLKRVSVGDMKVVGEGEDEEAATAETVAAERPLRKPMSPPQGVFREPRGRTPVSSGSWKPAGSTAAPKKLRSSFDDSCGSSVEQRGNQPVSYMDEALEEHVPGDGRVSRTVKLKPGQKQQVKDVETVEESAEKGGHSAHSFERTPDRRKRSTRRWVIWGAGAAALAVLLVVGYLVYIKFFSHTDTPGVCPALTTEPDATMTFALGQHLPAEKRKRIYHDAARFLDEQLDVSVKLVTPEDLSDLGRKLVDGEFDLLAVSPLLYVKMKKKFPRIEVIATPKFRQAAQYQGLILTRERDKLSSLEDLKGKRFCWVSKSSTSGYLFPRLLFRRKGLDPENMFSEIVEAGKHIDALRMLQEGKCDGTAVYSMRFMELKSNGRITTPLKIVGATDPIPSDAICAGPAMPEKMRKKIVEALVRFDVKKHGSGDEMKADTAISSFTKADDSFYKSVRDALDAEAAVEPGVNDGGV